MLGQKNYRESVKEKVIKNNKCIEKLQQKLKRPRQTSVSQTQVTY